MKKAIIGNGWSALCALSQALKMGEDLELFWVTVSAPSFMPPTPSFTSEKAAKALSPNVQSGLFTRVFKNRSFQIPDWGRDEEALLELWGPERQFFSPVEYRIDGDVIELLQALRQEVECRFAENPKAKKWEGVPLLKVKSEDGHFSLELGSGESIEVDEVIYADRWSHLARIQGMPKTMHWGEEKIRLIDISSRWSISSALQVSFEHQTTHVLPDSQMTFVSKLPRESGEKIDRHLMGYFLDSHRSQWTLFLTSEEEEDNHEIAKKIRRMKQTLNKMFADFFGEKTIMDSVISEQVRFQEDVVFGEALPFTGVPTFSDKKGAWDRFQLVTDEWGLSQSLEWAGPLETESLLDRGTESHPSDVVGRSTDSVADLQVR